MIHGWLYNTYNWKPGGPFALELLTMELYSLQHYAWSVNVVFPSSFSSVCSFIWEPFVVGRVASHPIPALAPSIPPPRHFLMFILLALPLQTRYAGVPASCSRLLTLSALFVLPECRCLTFSMCRTALVGCSFVGREIVRLQVCTRPHTGSLPVLGKSGGNAAAAQPIRALWTPEKCLPPCCTALTSTAGFFVVGIQLHVSRLLL